MKYPTQRTNTNRFLGLAHTAHRGEFSSISFSKYETSTLSPTAHHGKTQKAAIENIFKEEERGTLNCVSAILRPVQSTSECQLDLGAREAVVTHLPSQLAEAKVLG